MREIKFRAWDKEHQKMYPVLDLDFRYGGYEATVWEINTYDVEGDEKGWVDETNSVLMQYTGLKDKNGKEIYEGDIVKWNSWKLGTNLDKPTRNSEVVFEDGAWKLKGNECWDLAIYSNIEVVGNIYENPELLTDLQEKL